MRPSGIALLWSVVFEARSSCKPIPTGFSSTRTEIGNTFAKDV